MYDVLAFANLLTRSPGPPEPDPDLRHDLVQVRFIEPVLPPYLAHHGAIAAHRRLQGQGEVLPRLFEGHATNVIVGLTSGPPQGAPREGGGSSRGYDGPAGPRRSHAERRATFSG